LNARGLANRSSTLNVAKRTVTASLPRKRAAHGIVLSRDAGPAPGPRNGSHVTLAPRSVSHCDRPAGPGHPTTPNPKPHLTSNRSRDEIVSTVSCTSTTPTRPGREQAWDRAMNGDSEPLSDLAQNAGTRPSGRSASDGFACRRLAGFPRDRHVAFPIVSSSRLRQRVQGFLPPSPICFTPPVGLVASTLADVASLRA
jgi:hypothetical protein